MYLITSKVTAIRWYVCKVPNSIDNMRPNALLMNKSRTADDSRLGSKWAALQLNDHGTYQNTVETRTATNLVKHKRQAQAACAPTTLM